MFKKLFKNKTIIFLILSGLIILGFIGFWYYREKVFSKEILKLEILSSDAVKMGEEIEYTIKYKNNGNFALEKPKLVFEMPQNSLTEDSKIRITKNLDDIYPGAENFVKFKARLLGKEGDLKVAKASISYTPRNLSARYESGTTFTSRIESVPMTLTFDLPLRVEKNKVMNYSVNYFSNIDYPLENLSVKADVPSGFNFVSSDPISLDHAEWQLDVLQKGQGGRINIKGSANNDAPDNLQFTAKLGMWQDGNFIVIKETVQEVQVIQPLLFISQQINGSSNYVASYGETLNYEIFLRNIGATPFDDMFIISRIDGAAFDLATLQSADGQAKPNDNLIIFDSKQISRLHRLGANQEAKVAFSVKLKDILDIPDAQKNNIIIKNKVNALDITEEFITKVNSKVEIFQNASILENTESTSSDISAYSITWQVKNYSNDLKNVKVRALLPSEVSLNDALSPEDQASRFSFDSKSREIVWLVGDFSAGSQLSLTFQVSLTSSSSVTLISQAVVLGEDQFTGAQVQNFAEAITSMEESL